MNNNNLKLTLRFNAENKEFLGQVKTSAGAISDLGSKTNRTSSELSSLAKDSQSAGSGLSSLKGQIFGLVSGFSALATAINAKDRLGEYQNMRTQITSLVGSNEKWLETEQYLNQVAGDHNKTLDVLSESYARLLSLQNGGLITQQQTIDIFEGMSNAASANGATNAHLAQVMYGLQQAMASGVVRAEEFNQVTEPMPDLLIQLSKAAKTSVGGLREMVNSGKMTSQLFGETLVKALSEYDGAAAKTADNITAQSAAFDRAYLKMVVAYEKPISSVFGNSIAASTSIMEVMAENADSLSTLIGGTFFAAMGRGTVAIATQTKAKVSDILVDRQKLQATVATTQAELIAVQAEIRHLEIMQVSNNQKFRAIGAEGALTAAQARRAVLTDTLTAAQTRLNVASRAGSALMATLGGPAGIAMMAAGAIAYFATRTETAKESTDLLSGSVENLGIKTLELRKIQVADEIFNIDSVDGEIKKAEKRIKEIERLKNFVETNPHTTGTAGDARRNNKVVESYKRELAELNAFIEQQQEKREALLKKQAEIEKALNKPKLGPKDSPLGSDSNEESLKSGEKMLAMLSRQVALYGKASELNKINYEIEHGQLKGINEDLAKKLRLQAQILDSKRPQESSITDFFAETDEMESAWLRRLAMEAAMENKAIVQQNYAYNDRLANLREMYEKAIAAASGNKEQLAAIEAEYRYQQEIAEADHQARLNEIEAELRKQRENANKGYWQRYLESAKTNLENFDSLAKTTIDSFSSGMGNAFESMMFDADNLGNAMFNLAEGMSRSMINALGRMSAEWLAYQVVQLLVGKTLAQQQAKQAGINAYSSTAAIPMVGPALAPASMGTALAMTMPMAADIGSMSIAGMAHDGISRVPKANEGTWLLKQNEMVLNTEQADNFRWMVDAMREMKRAFSVMRESPPPKSTGYSEKPIYINYHGANRDDIETKTMETNDAIIVDVIVKKAVEQSLNAVYSDFDNGGPISKRAGVS